MLGQGQGAAELQHKDLGRVKMQVFAYRQVPICPVLYCWPASKTNLASSTQLAVALAFPTGRRAVWEPRTLP